MKNKFLTILFVMVFFMNSFSQKNVIKTGLFSVVFNSFSFAFEKVVEDNKSLQIGFYISGFEGMSGVGITPEFRFYPEKIAPNGFYLAPYLRFQATENDNYLGGGLIIGRQWVFGEVISLDIFIGPAFNDGLFFGTIVGLRGGLNLGIAF